MGHEVRRDAAQEHVHHDGPFRSCFSERKRPNGTRSMRFKMSRSAWVSWGGSCIVGLPRAGRGSRSAIARGLAQLAGSDADE